MPIRDHDMASSEGVGTDIPYTALILQITLDKLATASTIYWRHLLYSSIQDYGG